MKEEGCFAEENRKIYVDGFRGIRGCRPHKPKVLLFVTTLTVGTIRRQWAEWGERVRLLTGQQGWGEGNGRWDERSRGRRGSVREWGSSWKIRKKYRPPYNHTPSVLLPNSGAWIFSWTTLSPFLPPLLPIGCQVCEPALLGSSKLDSVSPTSGCLLFLINMKEGPFSRWSNVRRHIPCKCLTVSVGTVYPTEGRCTSSKWAVKTWFLDQWQHKEWAKMEECPLLEGLAACPRLWTDSRLPEDVSFTLGLSCISSWTPHEATGHGKRHVTPALVLVVEVLNLHSHQGSLGLLKSGDEGMS